MTLTALGVSLLLGDAAAVTHEIDWSDRTRHDLPAALDPRAGAIRLQHSGRAARIVRVEIPVGETIAGVHLGNVREIDPGSHRDRLEEIDANRGAPDGVASGYDYWILSDGFFRGHRIAHVLVHTERETDAGRRALGSFTLDITTRPAEGNPVDRRIDHPRTRAADRHALEKALDSAPLPAGPPSDAEARTVPPELGTETVEYVIITPDAFAATLQEFADLKTEEGMPAKVTTIEWILANYEEIDLPARIRAYLTDVYRYQGLRYALLAGDTNVVPERVIRSRYQSEGANVTSEIYFACLDGDYNADGDEHLGEAMDLPEETGDDADFYHEIAVSRVPVSDVGEAATFVTKWKSYTGYDPGSFRTDYQHRILSLGEVLFPDSWDPGDDPADIALDGADLCEEVLQYMTGFTSVRLYEYDENPMYPGALPETKAETIARINQGYGIVDHVGHGFRTNMSVGDGKLLNADADAFVNNHAYSVMYAANCNSGAVAYDAISEHLINNPNGGIIGGISSTDLDYPYAADNFKYRWFEDVFTGDGARLADAFYDANLPAIPVAMLGENSVRWTIQALIAQGDPALDIWRDSPQTLDVAYDTSYEVGTPSMTVTVTDGGTPVEGALACLSMADGSYGVATTNGAGVAEVPFLTRDPGAFTLTVTKNSYVPKKLGGNVVAPVTAALRIHNMLFHDGTAGGGTGNGDLRPDAGESIVVDVTVSNEGSQSASGIEVVFRGNSPYLSVTDSTTSVATTAAGGQRVVSAAFAFDVSASLPDSLRHARVPATFDLMSVQGSWTDEVPFSVYQRIPRLSGLAYSLLGDDGDGVLESGESVSIDLTLMNRGEADAIGVTGIAAVGGSFVMTDDTISFGTIPAGDAVTAGSFEVLSTGGGEGDLTLSLVVSDAYSGNLFTKNLDIVAPPAPSDIEADPRASSIRLYWPRPASDTRGYRVYRSPSPGGPYTELTGDVIEGGAFYTDEGLPSLTAFYYQVAAVDSSGNQSAMSTEVSASTSPPFLDGWPVPLPSGLSNGSPAIVDFDEDGAPEIVLGWTYPMVIRGDGTEYIDGDENSVTLGIFSTVGSGNTEFWASPAIGDIDGDGVNEAVFCSFEDASNGTIWAIDETGAVEPGWPRTIGKLGWSTPAIGDVDGQPGMEIFMLSGANNGTYQGTILGFHHDGTEVRDGDNNASTHGIFRKGPAGAQYMYGSLALAPIANAGYSSGREIVVLEKLKHTDPSEGRLSVFIENGTQVPGFPYGEGLLRGSTSSPIVADVDGDGQQEIIIVTENRVDVVKNNGLPQPGWPKTIPAISASQAGIRDFMSSPAIGDINLDGHPDIVLGWLEGRVYAWRGDTGTLIPGFPYEAGISGGLDFDRYMRTPIIGNIDGDPNPEILVASGDAQLFGINHDGSTVAGFPLQLDATVYGAPALGDVDGDGDVNLVVQTAAPVLEVYDFAGVPYDVNEHPWPMWRHNPQRDGTYRTPSLVATEDPATAPSAAAVHAPFPNPFSSRRVEVPLDVPEGGSEVIVRVFDVTGREVRRLADGRFPAGRFRIQWDGRTSTGRALAPGVYFTRISIGDQAFMRKLTMLR